MPIQPLAAGSLRHRLAVQAPVSAGQDSFGQPIVNWTTRVMRWGQVDDADGSESWFQNILVPLLTHVVTMRHYDGLTTAMRLVKADAGAAGTSSAAPIGTGPQTVTPGSMNKIRLGGVVVVDTVPNQEQVNVTAITATTFTAAFALSHLANVPLWVGRIFNVQGIRVPEEIRWLQLVGCVELAQ
jgi:head-tail adaptor